MISLDDGLIRADDIIVQYVKLNKCNPSLAFLKVYKGLSHIDFTYQAQKVLAKDIIEILKK